MDAPTKARIAYVNHRLKFEPIINIPLLGTSPS
jgi:hypothetical protein